MFSYSKYFVLTSLLAIGLAQTWADQTNRVQALDIQLSGLRQGRTTTSGNITTTRAEWAAIDTRQVTSALGEATGSSFSRTARLLLITPLDGSYSSVVIRDGANSVDVTEFFVFEVASGDLRSGTANARTGAVSSDDYYILHFALCGSGPLALKLNFDVRGIAVTASKSTPSSVPTSETTAEVSGAGDRDGDLLILQGEVHIHGRTLEVVSSNDSTS
jgi:hypothetical protein